MVNDVLNLLPYMFLAIVGHIVVSTIKNLNVFNMDFDWKKMINGVVKGLAIGFGFVTLALVYQKLIDLGNQVGDIEPTAIIIASMAYYGVKIATSLTTLLGIGKVESIKPTEPVEEEIPEFEVEVGE